MEVLTKREIADILLDYSIICLWMKQYPESKAIDLYKNMISQKMIKGFDISNYNENSYSLMLKVYEIINCLKVFSYYEEKFIDSIDNDSLDLSEFKKNINDGGIFVEGNGNNFSNKQLILFIRNAFNHNDDDSHSKFNISRDGNYIEIYLQDVRKDEQKIANPNDIRPFHIKISSDNFIKLFLLMNKSIQNYNISFHTANTNTLTSGVLKDDYLDNFQINRIVLKKKVPEDVLNEIFNISKNNLLLKDEKILKLKDKLRDKGIEYKLESYPLDDFQKNAVKSFVCAKIDSATIDFIVSEVVREYTPLGMEKSSKILNELFIMKLFNNPKVTYKEISNSVGNIINLKSDLSKELNDMKPLDLYDKLFLGLSLILNMDNSSFITYIAYVISNSSNDGSETIINEVTKEHLRNSLTHGWYFIDRNNNLVLYDNFNQRKNDYEFYWHKSVPFTNLVNVIIEKYHTSVTKTQGIKK